MTAILGKKLGMTQVYKADGSVVPVTVIEARPGTVVQVKTLDRDGYEAVKVGFFEAREKALTKPVLGVFKKAGVKPHRTAREFPMGGLAVGDAVTVEGFAAGDTVSVTGVSKGKGFQGPMKRHHFAGGPATHGSMFNRAPGSIGASSYPSRVWKNQRMAGQMGAERVTTRNLEVVEVRAEQNLILVRGSVPGPKNSIVEIRKD
ncbi:MAG: 50S ribosomal protein L3 [Thermodesulfovibrionales bacterium]